MLICKISLFSEINILFFSPQKFYHTKVFIICLSRLENSVRQDEINIYFT